MKTLSIVIPVYDLLNTTTLNSFKELIKSIKISVEENKNSFILESLIIINDFPEQNVVNAVNYIFSQVDFECNLIIRNNIKNKGQAFSRNLGAKLTKADYLHFIDQDDLIQPCFYEMLKFDDDILLGNIYLFDDQSKKVKEYYKSLLKKILGKSNYIRQLKFLVMSNISYSPGQYIVSKNAFTAVSGFPDLKYKGADDYGFFIKLIDLKQISINFFSACFFYYRLHPNQSKNSLNMQESIREFYFNNPMSSKMISFLLRLKINTHLKYFRIFINRLLFFNSTKFA